MTRGILRALSAGAFLALGVAVGCVVGSITGSTSWAAVSATATLVVVYLSTPPKAA